MKERIFLWIPRVLTILAILFMMMFSIDVFEGNEPLGIKLVGFLIHNIPAFLLTCVLVLAWKYEVAAGIIFIVFTIAGSFFLGVFSGNPGSLIVIGPFVIIGLLFILHHIMFNKKVNAG